uniref:Secreted protein n=1 Tax=Kalanchoe fedtschenkoi TaxID=63787 RepID=A0A7N0VMY6_KALFE
MRFYHFLSLPASLVLPLFFQALSMNTFLLSEFIQSLSDSKENVASGFRKISDVPSSPLPKTRPANFISSLIYRRLQFTTQHCIYMDRPSINLNQ